MPRLFLMWYGIEYDFWLIRRMHPEGCDLEIAADQQACQEVFALPCFDEYVPGRSSLQGGLSYFSGHASATSHYAVVHNAAKDAA